MPLRNGIAADPLRYQPFEQLACHYDAVDLVSSPESHMSQQP
jgi:hypothetical protein